MRIDGKTQLGMEQLDYANRVKNTIVKKADKEVSAEARPVPASDAIEISGLAKEQATLTSTLKDLPDVRNDKVAELKARIEAGNYNVSGKDIASKIVDSALHDLF